MIKQHIQIKKDYIIRYRLEKKELKKNIIKSLLQNNNIINFKRIYLNYILIKFFKSKKTHLSKTNQICLKTGKIKGFIKGHNFSRHQVKILSKRGLLVGWKKCGW